MGARGYGSFLPLVAVSVLCITTGLPVTIYDCFYLFSVFVKEPCNGKRKDGHDLFTMPYNGFVNPLIPKITGYKNLSAWKITDLYIGVS